MGRKAELTIPKGFKDKNGKVCTDDICLEVDESQIFPLVKPVFDPMPQIQSNLTQTQQIIPPITPAAEHPHDAPKITHEDIKQIIPKGINKMKCPGGNCGNEALTNPIQTKKYKTCPNGDCGANTLTKDSDFCPYCTKSIDEDDDLDDGIDLTSDEDE